MLRDIVVFLAGMEFFHTVIHTVFAFFVPLPLDLKFYLLTPTLNLWGGIITNGIITIFLLWWAVKLRR